MPQYHVQRSILIHATPEKVFDYVVDYGSWTSWSPWLCAEPDAEVVVSEDASSVGSTYAWKGEIVGEGMLEHLRLEPGRSIEDEIRFVKPFKSTSRVAFDLEPAGENTKLTWHMQGSLPWFLFWMRSMMQVFIGMDYERGLRMLKEWIETGEVLSETKVEGVVSVGPLQMVGVRQQCAIQAIGESTQQAIGQACKLIQQAGLATQSQMISVYHDFNVKAQTFDFTTGYLVDEPLTTLPAGLSSWSIPTVQALRVDHFGSYEHLGNAWSAANQIARARKLKQCKLGAFELYKNSPEAVPPRELHTEIYLPLKS